jgi:hypothetical protein
MLKMHDVLLTKNGKILSTIKEFRIKVCTGDLFVYAETLNTDDMRCGYLVNSITTENGSLLIDLKEIDVIKNISESEKLIDIRDFLLPPKL